MRVVIVGGGAIGASIAWRLARSGAVVTVVDDPLRAGTATRAAGGMLAPLAEAHRSGPLLDLGMESLALYPEFVAELEAETGHAVGYARAGRLIAALTAGEEDDLAAAFGDRTADDNPRVQWLEGVRARALEPALSDAVRAAVLIHDDHRVDNVALGSALAQAASLAGVDWMSDAARALLSSGGRASGIETTRGRRIDADVVVLAAGAWSGELEGLPRALPVRPVRGQMLSLRPMRPLFGRTLAGAHGYLVPRPDGRVVIGSTMEDVGFDPTTTPAALAELRAAAIRLVPALAGAARAAAWAGLRPGTPDGLPILGREPALTGLVYATGHFRNGILLTPVTAKSIAALILGAGDGTGEGDLDLTPYTADRFEATSPPPPADAGSDAVAGSATRGTTGLSRVAAAGAGEHARPPEQICDLCGGVMYEVHCKVICASCGYKRDCTDLW